MEQNVRDKEKKMAEEQELTKRKTELGESISSCAAEEKKVRTIRIISLESHEHLRSDTSLL